MESFNWLSLVIFPYVNFFLFLGVLVYFARKPLNAMTLQKRAEYERVVLEANRAKAEADAKLKAINSRLSNLAAELLSMKNTALAEAEEEANKIVQQGERLAKRLKEDAHRMAQAEVEKAEAILSERILNGVRNSVVTRLKSEMTTEKQGEYLERRLGVFQGAARKLSL